jgi:restriction system protein
MPAAARVMSPPARIATAPYGARRRLYQPEGYQPGNTIGSETVQAFIGALIGTPEGRALITTSTFSQQAQAAASQSGSLRLVLIDGEELTKLMVRFNVGVRVARTVEIQRIDLDDFEDDTE